VSNKPNQPDETYVGRAEREISALRSVFNRNWIIGLIVLLVLAAIGAHELGFFDKKGSNDAVLKLATDYADLSKKYIAVQTDDRQKSDAQKDAKIAQLQVELAETEKQLQGAANSADSAKVLDRLPSQAVNAYLACVQSNTTSVSFSNVLVSGGASFTSNIDSCKAILSKSLSSQTAQQ
jgi:hypothetical protein